MSEQDESAKRRNETLNYYPDVARFDNLADALTGTLAEIGSSLRAFASLPSDQPVWSPGIDHPDAPGRTVPEFARVGDENPVCEVRIASPPFALGAFALTFHLEMTDQDEPGIEVGTIITNDLATAALIIRGVLENATQMIELAQENDLVFRPPPQLRSDLDAAAVKRLLAPVFKKLENARRMR